MSGRKFQQPMQSNIPRTFTRLWTRDKSNSSLLCVSAAPRYIIICKYFSCYRAQNAVIVGVDWHSFSQLILRPYGKTYKQIKSILLGTTCCRLEYKASPWWRATECYWRGNEQSYICCESAMAVIAWHYECLYTMPQVHGYSYTSEPASALYITSGTADDWWETFSHPSLLFSFLPFLALPLISCH